MANKIKTAFLKAKVSTQVAVMNAAEKICKKAEKHPKVLAALEGLGLAAVANGINPVVAFAASDPTSTAMKNIKTMVTNIVSTVGYIVALLGIVVFAMNFHNEESSVKMKGIWAAVGGIIVGLAGTILSTFGIG